MLRQYSASLGAQPPAADIYYPSSGNSQSVMTSFGADGLENHIRIKLAWLYNTLQRSEKYQKYREKQPVLTPAEVVARDAADKKERERREAANIAQSQKETTVWPDFLENAFWRGKATHFSFTLLFSFLSTTHFLQHQLSSCITVSSAI